MYGMYIVNVLTTLVYLILVADHHARIAKTKTNPPFWRNLISSPNLSCFSFLPLTPSQHQYQSSAFSSGRVNLATPSTVSLLVSLFQSSVSFEMASEKTPEVGDKGTWSFLQRVAREQPFSFCGFYISF